eukprot:2394610-Rhodomonas_salina.2
MGSRRLAARMQARHPCSSYPSHPQASMQLQHCMTPFIVASPARWHQPASAMPSRSPNLPQEVQ